MCLHFELGADSDAEGRLALQHRISHILISIHQVHGDLLWLLILGAPSNTLAVTEETDMYTITTIKNHIPIDSPPTPMLSYTSCFGCPAKGETGNR